MLWVGEPRFKPLQGRERRREPRFGSVLFVGSTFPSPRGERGNRTFLFFYVSGSDLFTIETCQRGLSLCTRLFFGRQGVDVRFFERFVFALRFYRVDLPSQGFRVSQLCLVNCIMERMVSLFAVRLMDGADFSHFRHVRCITLRRSRLDSAIGRGEVLRYGRVRPSTTTFASNCQAGLITGYAGLVPYLVRRLYQRQPQACAYTVDFGSAVCVASLVQDGPRAYTYAYAGYIQEDCRQVETGVGVRRDALDAFTGGKFTIVRRAICFVFAVRRLRLFRMFSSFRPNFFGFYRVVFVIRAFRSLFITDFYHDVFLFGIVRSVACAGTVATRFVHVDQASAFSNDSCLDVTFNDFVDHVRGAIYERGRIHFLQGVRSLLRIVSQYLRHFYLDFRRDQVRRGAIASSVCLIPLRSA